MNRLPMETLKNAIGVYKNTLAVCKELADEDYSPALDKATLSFLEELKEYRGYGTVEDFRELRAMVKCKAFTDGYNKAIDDFVEKISGYGLYDYHGNTVDILEIAEQLTKL